jgi:hypothetical protein
MFFDDIHQVKVATFLINLANGIGFYYTKTVLGAVTLTTLSEATMSVSYKLMGASARNVLDFECKVDMLEARMMTVFIQMCYKTERVLRV